MSFRNSDTVYGSVARAFHWLIAVLVFAQWGMGSYVSQLPLGLARLQWMSRHKSLGVMIFILVVLRLAWRWFNPAPRWPDALPRREAIAAVVVHGMLYLLLLAAPVTGWLQASALGLGINVFGLFTLPELMQKNPALAETFGMWHTIIVYTLAGLIVLHVAAALRHVTRGDELAHRMLPFRRQT